MAGRIPTDISLDARTSRAVAQGIGEKLRQTLSTESGFPDKLQKLLDEMDQRESGQHEMGQASDKGR